MVLAKVELARQALAEACTIKEAWYILNEANAALKMIKVQRAMMMAKSQLDSSFAAQNFAAEIKIRAQRLLGQLTRDMPKNEGAAGTGSNQFEVRSHDVTAPQPPTYAELGLDKMTVSRWQAIASVPEVRFEEFITKTVEAEEELTSVAIIREAKRILAQEKTSNITLPPGKYRVIYADPPWKYQNTMPDYFYEQADHYPLLTVAEVAAFPVKDLAFEDAVLFLWVTSPILEEAFEVIKAWGFQYKASFVWDKIRHNMGHYNSVRHEFLLVCVRGSCQPDAHKLFDSVVSEERQEHSAKPLLFYDIIETLYTQGNKLELFQRGPARAGWVNFGYEAQNGKS